MLSHWFDSSGVLTHQFESRVLLKVETGVQLSRWSHLLTSLKAVRFTTRQILANRSYEIAYICSVHVPWHKCTPSYYRNTEQTSHWPNRIIANARLGSDNYKFLQEIVLTRPWSLCLGYPFMFSANEDCRHQQIPHFTHPSSLSTLLPSLTSPR